jgi:hypothetical protein
LSSNPASSRSTRGRGIIDWVVVGDSALPIVLAHPTIEPQMTATASAVVGWRMFLPVPAVPDRSSVRDTPYYAAVNEWCSNSADADVRLQVCPDNEKRCP